MNNIVKKIFVIIVLLVLIIFGVSYIPRRIDKSYDAIMYLEEAYNSKDYNNLDIKKTTLYIKGKLYMHWFKDPLFVGYIDSDLAPINKSVTREANVYIRDPYPNVLVYYTWNGSELYPYHYATTYFSKDLRRFYIQFAEESELVGYCLVAPANDIEDIDNIIRNK